MTLDGNGISSSIGSKFLIERLNVGRKLMSFSVVNLASSIGFFFWQQKSEAINNIRIITKTNSNRTSFTNKICIIKFLFPANFISVIFFTNNTNPFPYLSSLFLFPSQAGKAHIKKAGSPLGNPAVFLRSVAFRHPISRILALSGFVYDLVFIPCKKSIAPNIFYQKDIKLVNTPKVPFSSYFPG